MRKRIPHTITCWLFFLISVFLYSQQNNLRFDHLTTENTLTVKGLSQNTIYCILQDAQGFIWIGTWDGLNKYDGYNYVIYNTSNGLSNSTIYTLLEDQNKNLWIGTDQGLNFLNRNSGKIVQYRHTPDDPNSLGNDIINHLFLDRNGMIWISTADGLNSYDRERRIFYRYNFYERDADSALTNYVTRTREDANGNLWICTRSGIHCLNPENQSFKDYKPGTGAGSNEQIRANSIQDIAFDENGHVYAATLNGVYIIKPDQGVIHHFAGKSENEAGLSGRQVNAIMIDSRGLVWIGTSEGLDLYNPSLLQIMSYTAGENISNLSNEDVKSLFEDQSGTVWIGTYKGLNKVDRSPSRFMHFRNNPENPNSLSNNIVYSILEISDNTVWIGTYGGVNVLDRKTGRFSYIRHETGNPASLSSNKIRSMVRDNAGNIWIGTESEGINRFNTKTGHNTRFLYRENDPGSIDENVILSMFVDSKGQIWVGTSSAGISILQPSGEKTGHLSAEKDSPVILSNDKIEAIYEDRQGNIWIGTYDGLNVVSPELNSVRIFRNDPSDPHSISNNRIFSIYQDSRGVFWIGTMGGGLNRYDPATDQFRCYDESRGLPNNVVYATLEDDDGNLWLSTNWGLSKFNLANETFVNYDSKDGVQSNEFNAGAYLKNKNGEMYFGGMNGFNVFHPSEITLNKVPPRIVLTGFRILNDLVTTELENGQMIRLNYMENFFSIEFSGLDYTNPSKNLYRYKLENYDEEWVFANAAHRRADYRKVDPGRYTFMVTGSNNDGVWNQQGTSLTIIISPPWWKTWIFRFTLVFVVVALLWGIILMRIKSIRSKHEVEKKMLSIEKQVFELEQKALRLQMNPHFIFNSLNAIQNFVLANDTDKAVNYLAKFSHLMRMILANSTATLITLKDELKALTYYIDLEKLRFDDKFDYVIIREPSIDEEFVEIPPMLFQPYVENAIIHGLVNSPKPGVLEISIKRIDQGTLLCTIRDNGIGREKAIEIRNRSGIKRQPKGMIITQERIEIFNQQNRKNFAVRITDLKDEKGIAAGTLVEFIIQYKEL